MSHSARVACNETTRRQLSVEMCHVAGPERGRERPGQTQGERPAWWRSKGRFQKLTARAKTSVLSPSEVAVLCSGQSSMTSSSAGSTFSAVVAEEAMVLHRSAAALWGQSCVSGGVGHSAEGWAAVGETQGTEPGCLEGPGGSVAAGSGAVLAGLGQGGARGPWNSVCVWQSPWDRLCRGLVLKAAEP